MNTFNRTRVIGFDKLFDDLLNTGTTPSYPPYNIIKTSDVNYVIEVAAAGFKPEDIDITIENDKLKIACVSLKGNSADATEFVHRGIAKRAFELKFTLDKFIEVMSAEMNDGIISINLEKIVPDSMKPRKISVSSK